MKNCKTCNQPILDGERVIRFLHNEELRGHDHENPADCVAATARNCHRIAREVKERAEVVTNVAGASSVMDAIQAEYPTVFAQEEGR